MSWDIRLLKGICLGKISDRARLEGLFEVFNLTNHANYGQNYFNAIDQPNFGKPINIITPTSHRSVGREILLLSECMASGAKENQPAPLAI